MKTQAEQRAAVRAEVKRRLSSADPVERVTDLVCEWRDRALALMAVACTNPQAPPCGAQDTGGACTPAPPPIAPPRANGAQRRAEDA